jgi:hypothetical protein
MTKVTFGNAINTALATNDEKMIPLVELGQMMRTSARGMEHQFLETIKRGEYKYPHLSHFYVQILVREESMALGRPRRQYLTTIACPTPHYGQTVWKYTSATQDREFLWVIPIRDECERLLEDAVFLSDGDRGLLKYVYEYNDGTLDKICKEQNGEKLQPGCELAI